MGQNWVLKRRYACTSSLAIVQSSVKKRGRERKRKVRKREGRERRGGGRNAWWESKRQEGRMDERVTEDIGGG